MKMVGFIKAIGKMDRQKDLGSYIINQESWHIKVTGEKGSFMDKEKLLMNLLRKLWENLTIRISQTLEQLGYGMKETFSMIISMDLAL